MLKFYSLKNFIYKNKKDIKDIFLFALLVIIYYFSISFIHELGHWFFAKINWMRGTISIRFEGLNISGLFILNQEDYFKLNLSTIQLLLIYLWWMIFEFIYTIVFILIWFLFLIKTKEIKILFTLFFILVFTSSFYLNIISTKDYINNWVKRKTDWQNIIEILNWKYK